MSDAKKKIDPAIETVRLYRNGAGGPINKLINYLEYTKYDDGSTTFLAHYFGGVMPKQQKSWTFKDAESLVSTGNWIVEVFDPNGSDKPEATGYEVAW